MSVAPSLPFRLESVRRSRWLAGFLLLVCLLRVGMVVACTPHDLAELGSQDAGVMTVAHLVSDGDRHDPSTGDASGHCTHCACHHAVALPAAMIPVESAPAGQFLSRREHARASVPPSRDLRPPIA